ncbi:hypothetical protein D7030_09130 [Flavobacteriaceae bacterium AU392]|nr:hypothetical protein D1817_15135 [Flavobacteriaceae bacterium]RKM84174.1 hypothetical protein D7030_09130 [Flavobacteriaceae bacterium AU392]
MKKHIILIVFAVFSISFLSSQEYYTVNGKSLELKTEAKGTIDLLWNIIDRQYRYFVRKNDIITELTNTKGNTKKFKEEYKVVLQQLSSDQNLDISKVNFTLTSLRRFINKYNLATNTSYSAIRNDTKLKTQLLLFGGITNNVFVVNPSNVVTPFFGAEIELFTENRFSNHAAFFNVRHVFEQDDFDYSETQLALGYRYRFINTSKFNIYGNVNFLTYSYVDTTVQLEENMFTERLSDGNIDFPFIIGLGADIKLSSKSFITLAYNEIFALFEESSDNFPIDFAIGIKFAL